MSEEEKQNQKLREIWTEIASRGSVAESGVCPEPEILSAYTAQMLDEDEKSRWELHFSFCPGCQVTLAGLAAAEEATATAQSETIIPMQSELVKAITAATHPAASAGATSPPVAAAADEEEAARGEELEREFEPEPATDRALLTQTLVQRKAPWRRVLWYSAAPALAAALVLAVWLGYRDRSSGKPVQIAQNTRVAPPQVSQPGKQQSPQPQNDLKNAAHELHQGSTNLSSQADREKQPDSGTNTKPEIKGDSRRSGALGNLEQQAKAPSSATSPTASGAESLAKAAPKGERPSPTRHPEASRGTVSTDTIVAAESRRKVPQSAMDRSQLRAQLDHPSPAGAPPASLPRRSGARPEEPPAAAKLPQPASSVPITTGNVTAEEAGAKKDKALAAGESGRVVAPRSRASGHAKAASEQAKAQTHGGPQPPSPQTQALQVTPEETRTAQGAMGAVERRDAQAPRQAQSQDLAAATPAPPKEARTPPQVTRALQNRSESAISIVAKHQAGTRVFAPSHRTFWILGARGSILRSVDAGASVSVQQSGVTVDLLAGSAPSDTVCWVVGRAGTILLTTDGEHWSKVAAPGDQDWVGVEAVDALHAVIWDNSYQHRFFTSDGGKTWYVNAPTRP